MLTPSLLLLSLLLLLVVVVVVGGGSHIPDTPHARQHRRVPFGVLPQIQHCTPNVGLAIGSMVLVYMLT